MSKLLRDWDRSNKYIKSSYLANVARIGHVKYAIDLFMDQNKPLLDWDSSLTYEEDDTVIYSGKIYRSKKNDNRDNPLVLQSWEEIILLNPASPPEGSPVYVRELSDFPTPSSGVITLEDNFVYIIVGNVDLEGNRLLCGENSTVLGITSENSFLTSTGLGVGVPLLTASSALPMTNITIHDVDTFIDFQGTNTEPMDWTAVNIVNVPNIGTIESPSNFIFSTGAIVNSGKLNFEGTVNTIAFNNSLLTGNGLSGGLINVSESCVINIRFRIIYSSIVIPSSGTGINISDLTTIPIESYILDVVNFSGGGTYLVGLDDTSNKSLFTRNKGIINTSEVSLYYMNQNATATIVSAVNTRYKVLGTTTSSPVTSKFTNTNNRATFIGAIAKNFTITATMSVTSGNNNQVGGYIAKNGIVIPSSEVYITTNGSGRAENLVIQTITQLSQDDFIEIFVENATAINNITITDLNVMVK